MKVSTHAVARLLIFLLDVAAFYSLAAFSQSKPDQQVPAETANAPAADQPPERFWIAGRYDGNRVIVYFDAVKFHGAVPSIAERLPKPVADGFFMPEKLPWAYISKLQQGPNAEHFKMGDKYDVLLGCGRVAPVTLTTMVGTEGDEAVGNDSYIGALATLDNKEDGPPLLENYYALRRHREAEIGSPLPPSQRSAGAGLVNEPGHQPVRSDIQSQILDLLTQRMQATATEAERNAAQGVSPVFDVESFLVADGTLRYYARAAWKWGKPEDLRSNYALAAWLVAEPKLQIVAVQTWTSPVYEDDLDGVLPRLLEVVDLGAGRTGIILSIIGLDSSAIRLLEYRDGLDFQHMRVLQSLEAGE